MKRKVAQAKPRTKSGGALTASEPSQDLSVTPFSALTAEESSAISYTVSEAGVATKFDVPPREIPPTVVVTTQKLIKDFNLTDLKQILQFTPGIHVENGSAWLRARGAVRRRAVRHPPRRSRCHLARRMRRLSPATAPIATARPDS